MNLPSFVRVGAVMELETESYSVQRQHGPDKGRVILAQFDVWPRSQRQTADRQPIVGYMFQQLAVRCR